MSRLPMVVLALLLAFLVVQQSVFIVDETEQAIVTQFGDPIGDAIVTAGLHFKTPFLQDVRYLDRRFLEWDGDAQKGVPTKDKRFLTVDAYSRWQIVDPLKYSQRVPSERQAQSLLDDIIDGATRGIVANFTVREIVRSSNREVLVDASLTEDEQDAERSALSEIGADDGLGLRGRGRVMADILSQSRAAAEDLGIEVRDVRFKRINYGDAVTADVYQRMISERNRIAARFVSEGEGESARIRGEKELRLKEIESQAYREAQEIIGAADAAATAIYAGAYSSDPDFYAFLKTMESYAETIDGDTWLVLSTDNEFLRYLKGPNGK